MGEILIDKKLFDKEKEKWRVFEKTFKNINDAIKKKSYFSVKC